MRDPEIVEQFAARLREARLAAGLSQETLASAAGLHRTAVGQMERGEVSPHLTSVMRLESALDLEPGALRPPLRLRHVSGGGPPVFEWAQE